jgi:hypothetical protein
LISTEPTGRIRSAMLLGARASLPADGRVSVVTYMTRRMMPNIGTTKAKRTARMSCLGVLMGPSCGPSISFVSCAAVIESSELSCDAKKRHAPRRKAIRAEP